MTTAISAVWANDGGDKVTQDELRANVSPSSVVNSLWNGTRISLFGAKNEVLGFNLVLEAASALASSVTVTLSGLSGPQNFQLVGTPAAATTAGLFSWVNRHIELFYVRYLQIKGLSLFGYWADYDPQVPGRLRRPSDGAGGFTGGWVDRPDHDKYYPDIAVPLELAPNFSIASGKNQSIWVDVYIPKDAPRGIYTGSVIVSEGGVVRYTVPVSLTVRNFTLPDIPNSKTMVAVTRGNIAHRYAGVTFPDPSSPEDATTKAVEDKHFLLAHRHKISLVNDNSGADAFSQVQPRPEWIPRLNGSLFSVSNGYIGPGQDTGNNIYVIGLYSAWRSDWPGADTTQSVMWSNTNTWETWFETNYPAVEHFLYLIDESTNYAQTEQWAGWIRANPGIGHNLHSFATATLVDAAPHVPSLDIMASWIAQGDTIPWDNALASWKSDPRRSFYMYNGKRPAEGSFNTEDDGVSPRELPWGQYKRGISRWFVWESTYYNSYQNGAGETNVFQTAQTFGGPSPTLDASKGLTSPQYSNGDGVLFYPGTDLVYPSDSYGILGPFASLRLKHWRRGIQDVDYLTMAAAINPGAVQSIVNARVPKVLWENGVNDPLDPSYVTVGISWTVNPNDWEAARLQLADIIAPIVNEVIYMTPTIDLDTWNVAQSAVALTPSDTTVFRPTRFLYIAGTGAGAAGTVVVLFFGDTTPTTITNLQPGRMYPLSITKLLATGTTCVGSIALY